MKMFRFGPVRFANPISLVSSPSRPLGSPARSMVFVAALLTTVLLGTSAAHGAEVEYSATPLHAKPWTPCPPATTTKAECEVIVAPRPSAEAGIPEYEGSGELGGLDPKDLRSAYNLPEKGGSGTTIAIVDAYNDPKAESDLEVYREHYGLSKCTEGNGCFKKVNASGETKNYPSNEWGWSIEISLDLDMVSAACQECHILLVEASSEGISALGAAEEEAVKLGASAISNSWNIGFEGSEAGEIHSAEETTDNKYFNHPGIPILFSGGDYGYAVRYPAVSQYVVAVGGTTLKKAEGTRGWTDEVWSNPAYGVRQKGRGTGSGCSKYETKPKWQADTVCSKRIETDVAADADWEKSPVSLYDSYELPGWETNGGTSASAPFVAGVEGLSTSHAREIGAEAFYKAGAAGKLFDVTKGSNGTCTPPSEDEYWCTAKTGYDGPTGWGTPDGVIEVGGPSATTEAATSLTESGATLNGTVNPNGHETKYNFEYGLTTAYGTKTAEESAGSGSSNVKVSKAITGLSANTTYHFRITATSSEGTTHGEDKSFKTAAHVPAWALQSISTPPESTGNDLYGVTCLSKTECIAVGEFKHSFWKTLAEKWNGTEWKIQETPNPIGEYSVATGELRGVSCTSSSACTAVGYYENSSFVTVTLAERWNGTEWKIQETPNPTNANVYSQLYGVSCTSSTFCMAAGTYEHWEGSTAYLYPFTEIWNGTEWKVQEPPIPTGSKGIDLSSVSCTSSTFCVANGAYTNSSGISVALAEKWNGTEWTIQTTPAPSGATYSGSQKVTCKSTTECTLVGAYTTSAHSQVIPYAERWNGTEWKVQETPLPSGAKAGTLIGVSCAGATECFAAGDYESSTGVLLPLSERWNGTEWKHQEPPNPSGAEKARLFSISCSGVEICTAVGTLDPTGGGGSEEKRVSFAERYS